LQERSGTDKIREYACIPSVDTFLCAKENSVFPVLIPPRQRIALSFHTLYNDVVRWLKPRSTFFLLGTITDPSKGKFELLVENALLRQQLIILHRQVSSVALARI
jgi:hypothetical protein